MQCYTVHTIAFVLNIFTVKSDYYFHYGRPSYEPESYEYSPCTLNSDCNMIRGGELIARCNKRTGNCECFDKYSLPYGDGTRNAILIDKTCYTKKRIGENCTHHDECKGKGAVCSGVCQCSVDYILWPEENKCLPMAHEIGDPCKIDKQCKQMGDLSVCLESSKQCGCSRKAIHFDYRECFLRKKYYSSCSKDEECQANLGRNAKCGNVSYYRNLGLQEHSKICHTKKSIGELCIHKDECEDNGVVCSGVCQCPVDYLHYALENTCLPKARKIGDPCKFDEQCRSMGNLSICLENNKRCGCSSEAVHVDHKMCFPIKQTYDICTGDEECQASLGLKAKCGNVSYYHNLEVNKSSKICHIKRWIGEECIYHDECEGEGVTCSGVCQCSNDNILWRPENKCLLKAHKIGDPCDINEQCQLMGDLSICLESSKQCGCSIDAIHFEYKECLLRKQYHSTCAKDEECQASLGLEAKCGHVSYYRNLGLNESSKICYTKKVVGQPCTYKNECEGEGVICSGSDVCECSSDYILWQRENICLLKANELGDPCKINEQCQSIGNLSICLESREECGCSSEAIQFDHRECLLRKQYNDTCIRNEECQASLGIRVRCGYVGYYRSLGLDEHTKICYCPTGKVCRSEDYFGVSHQTRQSTGILAIFVFIFAFAVSY